MASMRLDHLCVELRPRSPWEAVELGTALVRRHPGTIWTPWLLASLPVFVLANAVGWAFDVVPWAGALMWWLKPLFDRIPLYVISRAVFGNRPATRETLLAQLRWGWRPMLHYLTWRRLGAARALYLPIDLLENATRPSERRRVIGNVVRGPAVLLTLVCVHFELALALAVIAMAALLVPVELLSESARAAWTLLSHEPPAWAQVTLNAIAWSATTVVEPFYVGAGFGLYLNRRTQIEAWDLEIAFRRMRDRLSAVSAAAAAMPLAVALALAVTLSLPAHAATAPVVNGTTAPAQTVAQAFGPGYVHDARFTRAVERTRSDPLLHPRRKEGFWAPRHPPKPHADAATPAFIATIGQLIAGIGEWGLWIALAVGVLVLALNHRRWRPWLQGSPAPRVTRPSPVLVEPVADAEALPADVAAAARRHWSEGRPRRALALLYRASVDSMLGRTGATLVPGATEAECLRASRALGDPQDRDAFAQAVRVWQYAAYAERLPATEDFEALVSRLAQRFGWAA